MKQYEMTTMRITGRFIGCQYLPGDTPGDMQYSLAKNFAKRLSLEVESVSFTHQY